MRRRRLTNAGRSNVVSIPYRRPIETYPRHRAVLRRLWDFLRSTQLDGLDGVVL